MKWCTYAVPCIDVGWQRLRTVRQTVASIAVQSHGRDIDGVEVRSFLAAWDEAKAEAHGKGWEGDSRIEPVVMLIPADTQFAYGFVLKQDNNGRTFVVAPVALPWLDKL